MTNKFLAVVGSTLALFGLGFLIYVQLGFHAYPGPSMESITKDPIDLPIIIGMEVLYSILLVLLFSTYTSIRDITAGAKAGLLIGLFTGGCQNLEWLATTDGITNTTGVITGAVTFAIRFAVAGGVVGYFLGKK